MNLPNIDLRKHTEFGATALLRLANMAVGGWLVYYTFFTIFSQNGVTYSWTLDFFRRVFFLIVGLILVVSDFQAISFVRNELNFLSSNNGRAAMYFLMAIFYGDANAESVFLAAAYCAFILGALGYDYPRPWF
jgi:hypothetical protein